MKETEETLFAFFTLPFMPGLSKNTAKTIRRRGNQKEIGNSTRYTKAKLAVYWTCVQATKGMQFQNSKLWLTIRVFKPGQRVDAINFLDGIADGVKDAINVDDKWYSAIVDWGIDKKNPRIEVFIRQWRKIKLES